MKYYTACLLVGFCGLSAIKCDTDVEEADTCIVGTIGCSCNSNGLCDPGLECVLNSCTQPSENTDNTEDSDSTTDSIDTSEDTSDTATEVSDDTVAKFCNGVQAGGNPIELLTTVSNGETEVSLTALSGECSSLPEAPCTIVPSGDLTIALLIENEGELISLWNGTLKNVEEGDQLFFKAEMIDDAPGLVGGVLNDDLDCASQDFSKTTQDIFRNVVQQ